MNAHADFVAAAHHAPRDEYSDFPPLPPPTSDPLLSLPENAETVTRWRAVAERGALAAKLEERFGNKRQDTEKYHVVAGMHWEAPDKSKRSWKPIFRIRDDCAIRAIAGEPTGSIRGRNGPQFGLGDYQLDEDNCADVGVIDIDDHEKTEESAARCLKARDDLADLCQRLRIPFIVNKSTKGRGWHFRFWFATRWHRSKIIDFLESLLNLIGSPGGCETYPKGDDLALEPNGIKIAGGQILRPYSLNAALRATGASCFYDRVSFDDWRLVEIEDAEAHFDRWEQVDDAMFDVVIEEAKKDGPVNLGPAARKRRASTAPRAPRTTKASTAPRNNDLGFAPVGADISTLDALLAWLGSIGYAPKRHWVSGSRHTVELPKCVLEEKHSSKTEDPVIYYDPDLGAITGHHCFHASCNAVELLTAPAFLRRVGVEYTTVHRSPALRPPAPLAIRGTGEQVVDDWSALPAVPGCGEDCAHGTSALDRALEGLGASAPAVEHPDLKRDQFAKHQRGHLHRLAVDQCASGSVERKRGLRASCCGLAQKVRWCKFHGKVHSCPLTCGRAGVCPYCSSVVALNRYEHVRQEWENAGWVIFDAGEGVALSDPDLSYREVRRWFARIQLAVRRRKIRVRRWFVGVHRVAFAFKDPEDAQYVADLLGRDDARLTAREADPVESAMLVHSLTMEPARTLAKLLDTADGMMAAANYPFLTLKHARRTGANLKGEQLPWLSEEGFVAAGKERARERAIARGEDPDAFDHARCQRKKQGPDGRPVACGEVLENKVEVGGVSIASGRPGGAAWRVYDVAFAIMAAERFHERSTTHRTT